MREEVRQPPRAHWEQPPAELKYIPGLGRPNLHLGAGQRRLETGMSESPPFRSEMKELPQ